MRSRPSMPEAQKAQPILQPTWEEMQTLLPCLYRIQTLSTRFPSDSSNRNFFVPSILDSSTRTVCRAV